MVRVSGAYGYPSGKAMQHRKQHILRMQKIWRKRMGLVSPHPPVRMEYLTGPCGNCDSKHGQLLPV